MAKGFKQGVGGSNPLNFKVVGGTTQPETAKENTIWIDTDEKITGWVFSATAPSSAEPGTVWISTGTSSTVEFNALKKNDIQVYPLSAKQYISGAWVEKSAKSFINGAWQSWIHDLYTDGSEWETASIAYGSEYTAILKPSVSKNSDGSTKLTYTHNSGEWRSGVWRLKTTQSLAGRNILKIQCSTSIPSKGVAENIVPELYVMPASASYWRQNAVALLKLKKSNAVDTLELDISSLDFEKEYSIGIGFRWNAAWLGAGTTTVTVHDVWLE